MAMRTADPSETFTLDQFIDCRDGDSLTYYKYSIVQRSITEPELIYSIDNLVYSYMDEFEAIEKVVELNMMEKIKYAYKPKLLSYDIYGSTELFFMILALNGLFNEKDFTLDDMWFYAVSPSDLYEYLNNIMMSERGYIELNRENMGIIEY